MEAETAARMKIIGAQGEAEDSVQIAGTDVLCGKNGRYGTAPAERSGAACRKAEKAKDEKDSDCRISSYGSCDCRIFSK